MQPGLSKRSSFLPFFSFVYLFYGLFIIYPSIARSRWSRLQAISIYSAARRLLFSLFPNTNVANFSAINCNVYISCHHHNLRKQEKKLIKSNEPMANTRLRTERETERRLPVSQNPENNRLLTKKHERCLR